MDVSMNGVQPSQKPSAMAELKPAFIFILSFALLIWIPLVWWAFGSPSPDQIFNQASDALAAVMFFCGAVIANATAVGGGMIFNPTLQLAFGVGGYTALTLSILVQCAGMSSGTYGWYAKGMFALISGRDLLRMIIVASISVLAVTALFLYLVQLIPNTLLPVMKAASVFISLYVFWIVWADIQRRKRYAKLLSAAEGADRPSPARDRVIDESHHQRIVRVDGRIFPWVVAGGLLNVSTSVGMGELVFSHLIKYYDAPAKVAIAVGTLLQALAVMLQGIVFLFFFREHIHVNFVLMGVLFCMMGGRLAPFILTRPYIEPHVKHILAFTALSMAITSGALLVL